MPDLQENISALIVFYRSKIISIFGVFRQKHCGVYLEMTKCYLTRYYLCFSREKEWQQGTYQQQGL